MKLFNSDRRDRSKHPQHNPYDSQARLTKGDLILGDAKSPELASALEPRNCLPQVRSSRTLPIRFGNLSLPRIGVKNLLLASLFAPVLLGSTLFTTSARAVDVILDGGISPTTTDCPVGKVYRLTTTSSFGGKQLDLLVEVLAQDNEKSNCISIENNTLSVRLRDTDPNEDVAFVNLQITVVEKGTTTPVEVDRLAVTGFDLDTTTGAGTDDLYFKSPDGAYISSDSKVNYSTGDFGGDFNTKLKGQTSGNCGDGPTTTVVDVKCRAGVIFTKGANGINKVSTFDVRLRNDNAFGTSNNPNSERLLQLSFELSYLTALLDVNTDYGDAPNSYGNAVHKINPNITLGNGTPADNESAGQGSIDADGDDTDTGLAKYDDEDGVKRNGTALNGQTFLTGTTINDLSVTTFGAGKLSAWIDLNRDGDFTDTGEKVLSDVAITNPSVASTLMPISIPSNATGGKSYMRFRYTTATGVTASATSTVAGEVEDYAVMLSSPAKVLLVKRITAINGVPINTYKDDTTSPRATDDNSPNWPTPLNTDASKGSTTISSFLRGATDVGNVKPGDRIEYTIYYLNSGSRNAKSARICDRLNAKQSFQPDTYGVGVGIQLQSGTTPFPLTNIIDGDGGQFISTNNTALPDSCNLPSSAINDNGALILDLVGTTGSPNLTALPGSTAQATPDSFGFWRFTTKVTP